VRHDKHHACYYCQKLVTNIWRHYQLQHSAEDEVQQINAVKGKEKKLRINTLRMLGDYCHNVQVLSQKSGELIIVRRPTVSKLTSYTDFLPCVGCKGFFLRTELWRHCKTCELRKQQSESSCQKEGLMLIAPVLYTAGVVSPPLAAVLATMASDNISLAAKNDSLILTYGSLVAQSCTAAQYTYVSQRMRQLARLLMELRNATETPDADLSSFLKPEKFDSVVAAVWKLCDYAECTKTEPAKLKVPSLALKLGYALRKCSTLLINKALREKSIEQERDAECFIRLYDSEWQSKVSSIALKTITIAKRNTPDLIPVTADLMKLKQYLQSAIAELTERLCAEPTVENYINLVECTLSRVILFNKRRGGEVARMTLSAYEKVCNQGDNMPSGIDDIGRTLSRTEQQLCNRLKVIEIAGKRNQTVPVLLTPDAVHGIDVIVANREAVGVNAQNLFIFARCSGLNSVDPFAAIRKVAECAGTERPELIRGTKLRKYVATVSQVLDMQSNELGLLCRHMGHSLRVHEDFYRLPAQTLEVAKVSKLLIAVEGGDLAELSGKTLNDLDISDIPDTCLYSNSDDESVYSSSACGPSATVVDGSDDLCEIDIGERATSKDTVKQNTKRKATVPVPQGNVKRKQYTVNDENSLTDETEDNVDEDSDSEVCSQRRIKKRKKGELLKLPTHGARKCVKKPWSNAEKSALFSHFKSHIRARKVPGKKECEEARTKLPVLFSRTWQHIKFAIKNIITSESKLAV